MKKFFSLLFCIILIVVGGYLMYNGAIKPHLDNKVALEQSGSIVIGDEVVDTDGIRFCVNKIENLSKIEGAFTDLETKNNFVVVHIAITNGSSEPYTVSKEKMVLLTENAEYESYLDASLAFPENYLLYDTLNPGISKEYVIVFETPTATVDDSYKIQIKKYLYQNTDSLYVSLQEVAQ